MKEGTYEHLDNDEYHSDPAIGSSGLKAFAECPAIYWHGYVNPDRENVNGNKYVSIGSHAHIALLEPHIFDKDYSVSPEFSVVNKGKKNEKKVRMTKAHGDWDVFVESAIEEGKKPLLYSEYKQAIAMAAAIRHHEVADAMLTGGKAEVSFFAKDPDTGLMMKSRPDYLIKIPKTGVVLVDYKTTAISLGNTVQSNHAFNLKRQIQAAHHKTVTELATEGEISEVCYVTQSQEFPHLVRVFRMPLEAIKMGMEERRIYLDGIAECKARGVYPDYPQVIEDMIIPRWLDSQFN